MTRIMARLTALPGIRTALSLSTRSFRAVGRALAWLFVALIGRWRWQPPRWIDVSGRQLRRGRAFLVATRVRLALTAAILLVATVAGAWYVMRPEPQYVTFAVQPPGLTEYDERGVMSIKPLTVTFSESAAPLKQLQKAVTAGIQVSPAVDGRWFWTSDTELVFTPRNDWPVDGEFSERFAKQGFVAPQVVLEDYAFTFRSQPFGARITESQFYQDPRDPSLKKLVATVTFTHPVDPELLERHVALAVAKDAEYLGLSPDSRHFTVAYDKFRLAAFIHSSPLAMPRDDTPMTLTIDKGVRASRGGNDTPGKLQAVVVIPGR